MAVSSGAVHREGYVAVSSGAWYARVTMGGSWVFHGDLWIVNDALFNACAVHGW